MDSKKKYTTKDTNDSKTVLDIHKRTDFTPGRVPSINEKTLSRLIGTAKEWTIGYDTVEYAINHCKYYHTTDTEIKETIELATNLSNAFKDNGLASSQVDEAWEKLRENARKNPATRDFLRCLGVNHDTESEYEQDTQENAIALLKNKYHKYFYFQIKTINEVIDENKNAVIEFKLTAEEFDQLDHEQTELNQDLIRQFKHRVTLIENHTDQFLRHLCDYNDQDSELANRMAEATIDLRVPLSPYRQSLYIQAYGELQEQRSTLNTALNNLLQEGKNLAKFDKNLEKESSNLDKINNNIDYLRKDAEEMVDEISKECYVTNHHIINSIKDIEQNIIAYEYIFYEGQEQKYTKQIQENLNNIKNSIHENMKNCTEGSIIVGIPVKEARPLFYQALRGEPKIIPVLNDLGSITEYVDRDHEIKARIGINKLFGLKNDAEMQVVLEKHPFLYNDLKLNAYPAITNALKFTDRVEIRLQIQDLAKTKTDDDFREALANLGEHISDPDFDNDPSFDSWTMLIKILNDKDWRSDSD